MAATPTPGAAAMYVDEVWQEFFDELDAADDELVGIEFL